MNHELSVMRSGKLLRSYTPSVSAHLITRKQHADITCGEEKGSLSENYPVTFEVAGRPRGVGYRSSRDGVSRKEDDRSSSLPPYQFVSGRPATLAAGSQRRQAVSLHQLHFELCHPRKTVPTSTSCNALSAFRNMKVARSVYRESCSW